MIVIILHCIWQEIKPELSHLAHDLETKDKFREETCCVIGKLGCGTVRRTSNRKQDEEVFQQEESNVFF